MTWVICSAIIAALLAIYWFVRSYLDSVAEERAWQSKPLYVLEPTYHGRTDLKIKYRFLAGWHYRSVATYNSLEEAQRDAKHMGIEL